MDFLFFSSTSSRLVAWVRSLSPDEPEGGLFKKEEEETRENGRDFRITSLFEEGFFPSLGVRAGSTAISLVEGKDPVMRGTNLHELRLAFIFCHEPYVFANIKIYVWLPLYFFLYFETAALTYRLILFFLFRLLHRQSVHA